jgi:hypothetical protein
VCNASRHPQIILILSYLIEDKISYLILYYSYLRCNAGTPNSAVAQRRCHGCPCPVETPQDYRTCWSYGCERPECLCLVVLSGKHSTVVLSIELPEWHFGGRPHDSGKVWSLSATNRSISKATALWDISGNHNCDFVQSWLYVQCRTCACGISRST